MIQAGILMQSLAFPDWLDNRTQSEAIELADNWLSRSIDIFDNRQNGILLLRRSGQGEDYRFRSSEKDHGYGGSPTLGVTWLAEDQASTYRHQFQGAKSTTISLSDLSARIEDMRPLTPNPPKEGVGAVSPRSRMPSETSSTASG